MGRAEVGTFIRHEAAVSFEAAVAMTCTRKGSQSKFVMLDLSTCHVPHSVASSCDHSAMALEAVDVP
jgi:hypothetical protein